MTETITAILLPELELAHAVKIEIEDHNKTFPIFKDVSGIVGLIEMVPQPNRNRDLMCDEEGLYNFTHQNKNENALNRIGVPEGVHPNGPMLYVACTVDEDGNSRYASIPQDEIDYILQDNED